MQWKGLEISFFGSAVQGVSTALLQHIRKLRLNAMPGCDVGHALQITVVTHLQRCDLLLVCQACVPSSCICLLLYAQQPLLTNQLQLSHLGLQRRHLRHTPHHTAI
jgi:hypothetical protein